MTSKTIQGFVAISLLLVGISAAFADDSRPRYVSGAGADKGDCSNMFRPCRTIAYAVLQAGKFDSMKVAAGEFDLQGLDNLILLLSADVTAGYDAITHFTQRDVQRTRSQLQGVPPEYREHFENLGFQVIVDRKGKTIARSDVHQLRQKLSVAAMDHGPATCTNGSAGSFACAGIDLLSHLSLATLGATAANDIWGYVDLNSLREYVIIGLNNGAAIIDVTEPEAPQVVSRYNGPDSVWRDVKVYQYWDAANTRWRAVAYITTETSAGLAVIDLSRLPNGTVTLAENADFSTAHNVGLLNANFAYGTAESVAGGQLLIAGADKNRGNFRVYNLASPLAPSLSTVSDTGYMHDAAPVAIDDARAASQCGDGVHCELMADFNEDSFDVWDLTPGSAPALLSRTQYSDMAYVHSGWWSEDGQLLFVQDELDELQHGLHTTLRLYHMQDVGAPQLLSLWQGPTSAIDHNGYARGNRYYMSNYMAGLTVVDFSTPQTPVRSGYFDTYPASSMAGFDGAWGVYPFLPSGTLAVSDISGGLFLLREQRPPEPSGGVLEFNAEDIWVNPGSAVPVSISRYHGSSGDLSVKLLLKTLGDGATGATLSESTLTWPHRDFSDKTVTLTLPDNAADHGPLLLTLVSPQGQGRLGVRNSLRIHPHKSASAPTLQLLETAIHVPDLQQTTRVVVARQGDISSALELRWTLQPELAGQQQGTLRWDAGTGKPQTLELPVDAAAGRSVLSLASDNAILTSDCVWLQVDLPARTTLPECDAALPPNLTDGGTDEDGRAQTSSGGGGAWGLPWLWLALCLIARRNCRR